jgi:multiple sugar transport system ATP-binding protein
MAQIVYENITKRFGSVTALHEFNLTIADHEFLTLVGPSGCGKSTTLNITAGLDDPSSGRLYIDDRLVNAVPPGDRDIAMVFQSYALYPHKTVGDNIGFGLKVRGMDKREIQRRVQDAANLLGIANLLNRKPRELSGGQRQRVALGRAITRNPKVFLLDEPLSNLDAKLRVQMRAELKLLFDRIQGTVLYVTHDQAEAMTMSHRVVVMNHGVVQQIGTPLEVYNTPHNDFVAGFLGSPAMNFIPGQVTPSAGELAISSDGIRWQIPLSGESSAGIPSRITSKASQLPAQVTVGIRPEDMVLIPYGADASANGQASQIKLVEYMGATNIYVVQAGSQQIVATTAPDFFLQPGDNVYLQPNIAKLHFFDPKGGANLTL